MNDEHHVVSIAESIATAIKEALGGRFLGAYLHGSAALGGFTPGRSDVDLLVIVDVPLDTHDRHVLGDLLVNSSTGPGVGIECSAVTHAVARAGGTALAFELHVATWPDEHREHRIVDGSHGPDPDLILHLAVIHDHGIPLAGSPPPDRLVAPVRRKLVIAQLIEELRWSLGHAPERYAVLNACRAHRYATDQTLCSKVDGGRWALDRGAPTSIIHRALDAQQGDHPDRPCSPEARHFVETIIERLTASPAR